MEYEKKYNDLIARINAVKNTPKIGMKGKHHYDGYVETGIRDALNYILNPESEDERIIRMIKKVIYDSNEGTEHLIGDKEVVLIMDWLEKQKEQKVKTDACGFPLREHEESACSYLERCLAPDMRHIWYEACAEIKERQKEQQPAEWSEEDKEKLNRIYEILGHAADDKGFLTSKRIIGDKEAIELQDFLKSLRPQPHWKPSVDQIGALNSIILNGSFTYVGQVQDLISLKDELKKL